jgi:hypothetical protein
MERASSCPYIIEYFGYKNYLDRHGEKLLDFSYDKIYRMCDLFGIDNHYFVWQAGWEFTI